MEDPVRDIHEVVRQLCQSDPQTQAQTIDKYFTKYASFTHPFCRTGTFEGSRTLIHLIFRWYKIMSPNIDLTIRSVAYDADNLLLYVTIQQIFRIWALPFHKSNVTLTTVLQLTHREPDTLKHDPDRYYIEAQNDLYQVDQFVRFVLPWAGIGALLVMLGQFVATGFCILGCVLLWPVTWLEQRSANRQLESVGATASSLSEIAGRVIVNGSLSEEEARVQSGEGKREQTKGDTKRQGQSAARR